MEPHFLGAAETRLARDRLDDREQAVAPFLGVESFQILIGVARVAPGFQTRHNSNISAGTGTWSEIGIAKPGASRISRGNRRGARRGDHRHDPPTLLTTQWLNLQHGAAEESLGQIAKCR
jgi:hypothetical protein